MVNSRRSGRGEVLSLWVYERWTAAGAHVSENFEENFQIDNVFINKHILYMVAARIKFKILMLAYRTATGSSTHFWESTSPSEVWDLQVSDALWYHQREAQNHFFLNLYLTRKWNSWDLKSLLQEDTGQDRQHIYLHKKQNTLIIYIYRNIHSKHLQSNDSETRSFKIHLKSVSDTNSFKHNLSCNWFQPNGAA